MRYATGTAHDVIKMAPSRKQMASNAGEDVGKGNPCLLLSGLQMKTQIVENNVGFSKKNT